MPKSKNYQWQKNWNVDELSQTAIHEEGLRFFKDAFGFVMIEDDDYFDAWCFDKIKEMGDLNARAHFRKLLKQAKDLLNKEGKKRNVRKPTSRTT